jgi:hypothetical protein
MIPATKTCEKCGWVYPATYPKRSCRFCGTPFKYGFCNRCGKYAEYAKGTPWCKKCESIRSNSWEYSDRIWKTPTRKAQATFDAWLTLINQVPKPFKPLTNEDWIKACIHFGKCALCTEDAISARAFFIPFRYGGRYAAWNVIPVCEKCALEFRQNQNPFIRYNSRLHYDLKRGLGTTNLNGIVDYLKPILEEAAKHGNNT